MEKLSCDHIIVKDEIGHRGETCTWVMVDVYTGFVSMVPCKTKSADEIEMAIRRFCGKRKPGIVQVSSDRAPEIKKALRNLGYASEPAAPYQKIKNALAESTIRTIKGMTSSILLHSGLEQQYWPLAQQYLEWAYNITTPVRGLEEDSGVVSKYELAMGYDIECLKVPFGALVWYKEPFHATYAPKGEPALFLGAELVDGMLFKGNYRVWPLEHFNQGIFKEFVSRSLAIPNGEWRFPARIDERLPEQDHIEVAEKDMEYEPSVAPEAYDDHDIQGEPSGLEDVPRGDSMVEAPKSPVDAAEEPAAKEPVAEAPVTEESGTKEPAKEPASGRTRRHRSITDLRIAAYGKTPGCDGCAFSTYYHSKACRKRFDALLDEYEPSSSSKGKPLGGVAHVDSDAETVHDDDYLALTTPITGKQMEGIYLEKGSEVVASIYLQELETNPKAEDELATKLALVMHSCTEPPKKKTRPKEKWFVEFCCSENSSCCRVAEACGIPYLGLSEEFGDLRDPVVIEQVMYWFIETSANGAAIDLWGSIPCGPYSPLQNLNVAVQGESYLEKLDDKRSDTLLLLDHFCQLAEVAVESGGSASFEWPLCNGGWKEEEVVQMILHFAMYSCYPSGCGVSLEINGLHPLKEWRVVTTSKRLAAHLDTFRCNHGHGHVHDPIEGGSMAKKSGIYNTKMAVAILSALNPEKAVEGIPAMPTIHGAIAHQERGVLMAQTVLGMVHTPLSRQELFNHPQGRAKIKEDADEMRELHVWDDDEVYEVEELRATARREGWKIHIAEAMPIGSIKNSESTDKAKLKVRLVFRGDDVRDEHNQLALFRELKSIPATIATVNLILWYGLRPNHVVQIADAKKAYLQAPIRSDVPTYVILPREAWLPHWFRRFKRVAARVHKAMYGHPTSGDDWQEYLTEIVVVHLQGDQVEGWPSLWHIKSLNVLVAAYVDDLVVAGPQESVPVFWELLSQFIMVDTIEAPGRYLGRDHLIFELGGGRQVFMSMCDYAVTAYRLYEEQFGKTLKVYDTPFVTEAALTPQGYEEPGQLAGKAAQLLMKLLWLARLSRPDISFAITSLASHIAKWTRNHDLMLFRLLGYVKGSVDLGLLGKVSASCSVPRLDLFADADLAGDPLTMKSHSGHLILLQDDQGTVFPLYWAAKKQACVSRSTTEAEIVSASILVFDEGIPIQSVLTLVLGETIPTFLREDNQAAVTIMMSGYSQKLRALNRTHRTSVAALAEAIQHGHFEVVHTGTKDQLADIFTKALGRQLFLTARDRLLVVTNPQRNPQRQANQTT